MRSLYRPAPHGRPACARLRDRKTTHRLQGSENKVRKTLCDLLGVAPNATVDVLKSAYLEKLAWLRGPNTGLSADDALNRLKALEEAFSLLNDPVRKAHYDLKLRERENSPQRFEPHPGHGKWLWIGLAALLAFGVWRWYVKVETDAAIARQEAIAKGEARLLEEQRQKQEELAEQAQPRKERDAAREQEKQDRQWQREVERLRSDTDRRREREQAEQERAQRTEERRLAREQERLRSEDERRRMEEEYQARKRQNQMREERSSSGVRRSIPPPPP